MPSVRSWPKIATYPSLLRVYIGENRSPIINNQVSEIVLKKALGKFNNELSVDKACQM